MDRQELPHPGQEYMPFWTEGTQARCIKDNPPMHGFGRALKTGDIVVTRGVIWRGDKYQLTVPAECAFYDMIDYFEVVTDIRSKLIELGKDGQ